MINMAKDDLGLCFYIFESSKSEVSGVKINLQVFFQ